MTAYEAVYVFMAFNVNEKFISLGFVIKRWAQLSKGFYHEASHLIGKLKGSNTQSGSLTLLRDFKKFH